MKNILSLITLIFSLFLSAPSIAGHCGGDHSHDDDKESSVEK